MKNKCGSILGIWVVSFLFLVFPVYIDSQETAGDDSCPFEQGYADQGLEEFSPDQQLAWIVDSDLISISRSVVSDFIDLLTSLSLHSPYAVQRPSVLRC